MSNHSTTQLLLATSAAFIGGVLVAIMTSPKSGKETRQWISENTGELQDWVESTKKDIKKKNIPDLYEATEDLGLTDEDLVTG